MNRKHKTVIGALIGALIAFLVAAMISIQFTKFASETNAIILEEWEQNSNMTYREAAAKLLDLHWRIADRGGWQGFLARKVLQNGGLGFPEVKKPTGRVWFWAGVVGALIGIAGAATEKWGVLLAVVAVAVWGISAWFTGSVALTMILWGGVTGGIIGGSVGILLPQQS